MAKKPLPTPEELRQLIRYDPETGKLFWKKRDRKWFRTDGEHRRWNGRYAGIEAGNLDSKGYFSFVIFKRKTLSHRIAWALYYGEWPADQIDHVNRIRTDNRISNLRMVSHEQNAQNRSTPVTSKSGHIGVCQYEPKKWRAYIGVNGRRKHLGVFTSLEQAIAARKKAEAEFYFS